MKKLIYPIVIKTKHKLYMIWKSTEIKIGEAVFQRENEPDLIDEWELVKINIDPKFREKIDKSILDK